MDAQLQRDLNQVISAIRGISPAITREAKKELAISAKPLMQSIKGYAPKGRRAHTRDSGSGRITYKPGNLKRSYRVLKFNRAKTSVFVGVKLGGAVDGYYAHFVNAGTINQSPQRFVEKGISNVGDSVLRDSINRISRVVQKYWISSLFGKK
jgi:HK97 gp10 family phage protein